MTHNIKPNYQQANALFLQSVSSVGQKRTLRCVVWSPCARGKPNLKCCYPSQVSVGTLRRERYHTTRYFYHTRYKPSVTSDILILKSCNLSCLWPAAAQHAGRVGGWWRCRDFWMPRAERAHARSKALVSFLALYSLEGKFGIDCTVVRNTPTDK
jgi:hypothetical protein